MASRVIQVSDEDFARLEKAGVRFKDVTDRERHLKLTINRLKCDLAGDSAHYFVTERAKFAQLARVASAAGALPLDTLAKESPRAAAKLVLLGEELEKLAATQPRRSAKEQA